MEAKNVFYYSYHGIIIACLYQGSFIVQQAGIIATGSFVKSPWLHKLDCRVILLSATIPATIAIKSI